MEFRLLNTENIHNTEIKKEQKRQGKRNRNRKKKKRQQQWSEMAWHSETSCEILEVGICKHVP